MKSFYHLAANSFIASLTTMLTWFALSLWVYTQTQSVLATSVMSGVYLVATTLTSIWFGSLVDQHTKKNMMIFSSVVTLASFVSAFLVLLILPASIFTNHTSLPLWIFIFLTLFGVLFGNIRGITMPTVVGLLVEEDQRDSANGLMGTLMGIVFLLSSVISGFLLAYAGIEWIFVISIACIFLALAHLFFVSIPENVVVEIETHEENMAKVNLWDTFQKIKNIPGLLALVLFTSFNNFLGGVFMPLMDPYGLSLVSLATWGVIWGVLSLGFILGGLIITKWGLGKNPLRTLLLINVVLWIDCFLFALQPSIVLLSIGLFIYMTLVPFVEAAEQTVVQKVVPPNQQGRIFGFAQSIESSAAPLTAFAIGPIAQYFFIPMMQGGAPGANLIGSWFGTGDGRGIALVFMTAGVLGLIVTGLAFRSRAYLTLSKQFNKKS